MTHEILYFNAILKINQICSSSLSGRESRVVLALVMLAILDKVSCGSSGLYSSTILLSFCRLFFFYMPQFLSMDGDNFLVEIQRSITFLYIRYINFEILTRTCDFYSCLEVFKWVIYFSFSKINFRESLAKMEVLIKKV